jgi:hypothetical protein
VTLVRLLLANLSAIACFVVAGFLAMEGKDGWDWFLFAALLFGSTTMVRQPDATSPTPTVGEDG